ncbi:MAG TPA: copper resistance CopC family protein [Micropepsaceae bacterium]|nr:copper resistance CopC family protein [Micropepsaceae bacterium]
MRLILAIAAFTAFATHANAHAFLVRSDPAVGTTVGAAPKMLRLEFSEGLELPFCGVDVTGSSGALKVGKPRFADATDKVLAVDLPALQPGNYQVKWHVVSADTHRTEGDFSFSLK